MSTAEAVLKTAPLVNETFVGNDYNFWNCTEDGWDLTRGASSNAITLNVGGTKSPIIVAPEKSALILIDMQNYFIHPNLSSTSVGRDLIPVMNETIFAFRKNNIPVMWVQWGLTESDVYYMPPAFLSGYYTEGPNGNTTLGDDMGNLILDGVGTKVAMGRKLMRGSWNAEPFGSLNDTMTEGLAQGTDLHFNKNRLSGLWGATTPLDHYLTTHGITTLFFGGVNLDQCVFGTMMDAFYKGYDTILVEDISATTSPLFATQMTDYNIEGFGNAPDGWTTNSTNFLPDLISQS
ncbi:Isochorismatase hydrolase [Punctularia strigosozonata HHB-11173 SS5]|uniref:Isochorismatase hydrolase n=1 Tax=Punctularia strigosozonata (strain HHB-11173) TaxID=741275 RepID=UPI0004416E9C|nr:Isochorismatase hydrolase [Punctularia strigosozonata HHB-11173 SS5]EIN14731.1 Isochorismatase hydrolase [Punctularia strigosozonata HHB-11173 SS5]